MRALPRSGGTNGGIATFQNAASVKRSIIDGISTVLGQDKFAHTLAQGAASVETSFATRMPDRADQERRGKYGSMRQEIGPMRMNRDMLFKLGYNEQDIARMNSGSADGTKLAAVAFGKGLRQYSLMGFMHHHRGGQTRYDKFKNNQLRNVMCVVSVCVVVLMSGCSSAKTSVEARRTCSTPTVVSR